jgi:hypothetical protein
VRTGLFAKHVVIPVCDGDGCGEQFTELLADMRQQYQPEGPFEEFCVVQIAECMWKLRRATRAERGSVRDFVLWKGDPPNAYRGAQPHMMALASLEKAKEEIRTTGTLCPTAEYAVFSILGLEPIDENYTPTEPKIDDKFLPFLDWLSRMAHNCVDNWLSCGEEMIDDYHASKALPPELVMNQILRYEKAAQKKLDWALQRLLESQQRRQKAHAPASIQV